MTILLNSVPGSYQDITTISAIAAPNVLVVTNASSSTGHLIVSATQPSPTTLGYPILSKERLAVDQVVGKKVWLLTSAQGPYYFNTSTEGFSAPALATFPSEVMSNKGTNLTQFIRVASVPRTEVSIFSGEFYSGFISRTAIAVTNTYYTVLQTGSKVGVIEHIDTANSIGTLGDGTLNITTTLFYEDSDINNFTYSGGTVSPSGRSLNMYGINTPPQSTITSGVTIGVLTGIPDFTLREINYIRNNSGNSNLLSTNSFSFFDNDQQIIVPPNKKVLIRTVSSGTATGNYNASTMFSFSEHPPEV
jgi:hypothetical protein